MPFEMYLKDFLADELKTRFESLMIHCEKHKRELYEEFNQCPWFVVPCLASLGHLTADKRKIKDFSKLPSVTSFIRKPLYEIVSKRFIISDDNYEGEAYARLTKVIK